MNRPKICMIEPVGAHGGMRFYDLQLCNALASAGADVVLHTCEQPLCDDEPAFEVRHTFSGIYGADPVILRGLRFFRAMVKALWSAVIERRRVVHFHVFGTGPLQLFQVLLARAALRTVIVTVHDVESLDERFESRSVHLLFYRVCNLFIVHNQFTRDILVVNSPLLAEDIRVICHGHYVETGSPSSSISGAREQLAIGPSASVLLFFGQIKESKGLDVLIDAMPCILRDYPNALLLIAGRPWKSDFDHYRSHMRQLGVEANCRADIKFIDDEDVELYFDAADIVVLPYRKIYQSGVLLLAMGYGKPVLTSDIGGMRELVEDGKTGFTFTSGDPQDLCVRTKDMLSDRARTTEVGLAGQSMVLKEHDWLGIAKKTLAAYRELS